MQLGLVLEVIGIVVIAFVVSPTVTFLDLLLGWGLFGFGIGFASSQLTNVILSDIPDEKSGVASGTNSTVRQVGAALGVAVIGSVFASLTVSSRRSTRCRRRSCPRRCRRPWRRASTRRGPGSRSHAARVRPTPPR